MYIQLPLFIRQWHNEHSAKREQARHAGRYQPNLIVFSGAGLSAESGIATFRGKTTVWNSETNARYLESWIIDRDLPEERLPFTGQQLIGPASQKIPELLASISA